MSDDEKRTKITVSVIGGGGGGSGIVHAAAVHLSKKGELNKFYDFRWYLYDLSKQIEDIGNKIESDTNQKIKPVLIKPTFLDAGAGGIPLCAEIAFDHNPSLSDSYSTDNNDARSLDVILPSSLNIYAATLGGGTGGRTISQLIPKLKTRPGVGTIADIAICVLTNPAYQNLNHIYTFPFINRTADFLILLENGIIIDDKNADENFINKRAAEIIDFIISIRHPDTRPKPYDARDWITQILRDARYDRARWLVPFMYPVEGYDKTEYIKEPLLSFVDKVFETDRFEENTERYKRCLCKVEDEKIMGCSSCLVIVKAPKEYIEKFFNRVRNIDGRKISEEDIFKRGLKNKLGIKEEDIIYAFTPDEEGFKICLLLQNIPILRLEKLKKYLISGDMKDRKKAWLDGLILGIDNMVRAGLIEENEVEDIKDVYKKKIDNLTNEFVENY